jgi:hypothetical protein
MRLNDWRRLPNSQVAEDFFQRTKTSLNCVNFAITDDDHRHSSLNSVLKLFQNVLPLLCLKPIAVSSSSIVQIRICITKCINTLSGIFDVHSITFNFCTTKQDLNFLYMWLLTLQSSSSSSPSQTSSEYTCDFVVAKKTRRIYAKKI